MIPMAPGRAVAPDDINDMPNRPAWGPLKPPPAAAGGGGGGGGGGAGLTFIATGAFDEESGSAPPASTKDDPLSLSMSQPMSAASGGSRPPPAPRRGGRRGPPTFVPSDHGGDSDPAAASTRSAGPAEHSFNPLSPQGAAAHRRRRQSRVVVAQHKLDPKTAAASVAGEPWMPPAGMTDTWSLVVDEDYVLIDALRDELSRHHIAAEAQLRLVQSKLDEQTSEAKKMAALMKDREARRQRFQMMNQKSVETIGFVES